MDDQIFNILSLLSNCIHYSGLFLSENWEGVAAFLALFLSVYEGTHQREHNRISLRPNLYTYLTTDHDSEVARICVELINSGLGPAHIRSYEIFHGEKLVSNGDTDMFHSYIKDLLRDGDVLKTQCATFRNGGSLVSNERRVILDITFKIKGDSVFDFYEEKLNRLRIKVQYYSPHGEVRVFEDEFKKSES